MELDEADERRYIFWNVLRSWREVAQDIIKEVSAEIPEAIGSFMHFLYNKFEIKYRPEVAKVYRFYEPGLLRTHGLSQLYNFNHNELANSISIL